MKKIIFIAKMNKIAKEINAELSKQFSVQLSDFRHVDVMNMMEVIEPDLVLASLIGVDVDTRIFTSLHTEYPKTPVLTIGDESEMRRVSRFYEHDQFENLLRPISNVDVATAVKLKLDSKNNYESD